MYKTFAENLRSDNVYIEIRWINEWVQIQYKPFCKSCETFVVQLIFFYNSGNKDSWNLFSFFCCFKRTFTLFKMRLFSPGCVKQSCKLLLKYSVIKLFVKISDGKGSRMFWYLWLSIDSRQHFSPLLFKDNKK